MKPHEETWETIDGAVEDGDYCAQDADGFMVITAYSALDDAEQAHGQSKGRLLLATAAPDMARALLECRRDDMHVACWCHQSRDILRYGHEDRCVLSLRALRKAGVLP